MNAPQSQAQADVLEALYVNVYEGNLTVHHGDRGPEFGLTIQGAELVCDLLEGRPTLQHQQELILEALKEMMRPYR